jgi:hypothetical protein
MRGNRHTKKKRQYTCHKRRNFTDFILKHCKYKNIGSRSAGGTALPPNFKAPDDTVARLTVNN